MEPTLANGAAVVEMAADPAHAYRDLLPISSPELIDEGLMVRTPCIPAGKLGKAIGVPRMWLKNESVQPTGTTKDRMAALVVAVFRQLGINEFVASSTGNSSTALARAVARDERMRAHFFCGRDFVPFHRFEPSERISLTVVDGSYATAGDVARSFAKEQGLCWEGGFFNWARRAGLKTAYLEAFDEMTEPPDVIVQAISSGMGVVAAFTGVKEYIQLGRLAAMPRFVMVQQDTCSPMATAWRDGRYELHDSDIVDRPSGLATAILLGDGSEFYPYIARIAAETSGNIVAVAQEDLVSTRKMIMALEGIDACYSAAAAVAGVAAEARAGRIDSRDVVLVNLTGRY
ncbi:pyridoxal-phosphate dependent enzyme [Plantactinospora sp. ZYX-F-223]|uniref:threonine synthase n=1 Tax=Plantactinospora sp. ZYX-F-223 TaxID=3144103 RepID=UPI0031FC618D